MEVKATQSMLNRWAENRVWWRRSCSCRHLMGTTSEGLWSAPREDLECWQCFHLKMFRRVFGCSAPNISDNGQLWWTSQLFWRILAHKGLLGKCHFGNRGWLQMTANNGFLLQIFWRCEAVISLHKEESDEFFPWGLWITSLVATSIIDYKPNASLKNHPFSCYNYSVTNAIVYYDQIIISKKTPTI